MLQLVYNWSKVWQDGFRIKAELNQNILLQKITYSSQWRGADTARGLPEAVFQEQPSRPLIPVLNFCGVGGKEERQRTWEGRSYWKSCQRRSGEGREGHEFAPRNGREVESVRTLSLFPGDLICREAPGTAVTSTSRNAITAQVFVLHFPRK